MAPRRSRRNRFLNFSHRTEDDLATLLRKELDFIPSPDYLDKLCSGILNSQARETVVRFTVETLNNHPDACLQCISFYDRYCSKQDLSTLETQHTTFIALACMILALKMEDSDDINTHTFLRLLLDVVFKCKGEELLLWEQMVYKMEATILNTLDWRMFAITGPRFIAFYLKLMEQEFSASNAFLQNVTDTLVELLEDVRFAVYRPSIVAAAVLLKVMDEQALLEPDEAAGLKTNLLLKLPFEIREGVIFCYGEIHEANLRATLRHQQQQSPDNILDNLNEDMSISSYGPEEEEEGYLDVANEEIPTCAGQSICAQTYDTVARRQDKSIDTSCSNQSMAAGRSEGSIDRRTEVSPFSRTLWCEENLEKILNDIPDLEGKQIM